MGLPTSPHQAQPDGRAFLSAPFHRTVVGCGSAITAIGTMALAGWATQHPILLGLRARYIPMAPNTALGFIAMGAGLVTLATPWRRPACAIAFLVGLVATMRLVEFATGLDLAADRLFVRVPSGHSGLTPVGKMALHTAVGFVAASVSMATCALAARGRMRDIAGASALVAVGIGVVFSLGYLFSPNAPLMYGTQSIPMALNTALAFVVLGVGLVAASGPSSFPLARLCGPSTQARLLRIFLPLVSVTVGLVAWLTHLVDRSAGASSAAITAAFLATASIIAFGALCERLASWVGADLERTEAQLQRANDQLEDKVRERTADLERSLGDLQRTHAALQTAHLTLKDAQARMLEQAKMASLGQTAAGVAHEINNPLAFVTNNIAVLRRDVAGVHDIVRLYQQAEDTLALYQQELLARIRELSEEVDLPYVMGNLDGLLDRSRDGLRRIQKIVADLRDFAHLDEADVADADLNAAVLTTVGLMRSVATTRGVSLDTHLGDIPTLRCCGAKLNLVLQNLLTNAIDACADGGQVVVSTRRDGDAVQIDVSDNGSGIDPSIRDRIFDPFFTTKPVGSGTGLGLAMSYGVVRDHGGTIAVESTPGQGARFTIRLPLAHTRQSA
jgi:signal transduction histidine kinase